MGETVKLTNQEILKIAMEQSAYDCACAPEDFLREENVVCISRAHPLARKYLKLPLSCDLVSYGTNIVAQASPEIAPLVQTYMDRYPVEHCFETPNLHVLDEMLRPFGQKVCFMAEYFLPDVDAVRELPCDYELRLLHQEDFGELYLPQWGNALCQQRKHLGCAVRVLLLTNLSLCCCPVYGSRAPRREVVCPAGPFVADEWANKASFCRPWVLPGHFSGAMFYSPHETKNAFQQLPDRAE